jgi:hypothetical protein
MSSRNLPAGGGEINKSPQSVHLASLSEPGTFIKHDQLKVSMQGSMQFCSSFAAGVDARYVLECMCSYYEFRTAPSWTLAVT